MSVHNKTTILDLQSVHKVFSVGVGHFPLDVPLHTGAWCLDVPLHAGIHGGMVPDAEHYVVTVLRIPTNRMLNLISRTTKYKNPAVLTTLYKSLEYCLTIWNPQYNKDKFLLERIQHLFTWIFPHLRPLPYETRLCQLGLWPLEERRNRADQVIKTDEGIVFHSLVTFFKKAEDTSTRGHTWKLAKKHCQCDSRLYFFSHRVINSWNKLSQEDVDPQSINCFKNRLEKRRTRQMDFFKDL